MSASRPDSLRQYGLNRGPIRFRLARRTAGSAGRSGGASDEWKNIPIATQGTSWCMIEDVRVTVRLFAGLRERAGKGRLELDGVERVGDVLGQARPRRRARRPPVRRQPGVRRAGHGARRRRRGGADPTGVGRRVPPQHRAIRPGASSRRRRATTPARSRRSSAPCGGARATARSSASSTRRSPRWPSRCWSGSPTS